MSKSDKPYKIGVKVPTPSSEFYKVGFKVPTSKREDYNMLIEDIIGTDGRFILEDVEEWVEDGFIEGNVYISFFDGTSEQDIQDLYFEVACMLEALNEVK